MFVIRFKDTQDTHIMDAEKDEAMFQQHMREGRREDYLSHDRTFRESNTTKDEGVTKRWKISMKHQLQTHIRDLQFELATQKVRALKVRRDNAIHAQDETVGIDEFEKNLRRNGLGGGDEAGGDPNEKFTVTYEDAELYWERLEEAVTTNEDASGGDVRDFLSQLKERTKEKRQARYEKARRKRRMLVDQANLAGSSQLLNTGTVQADSDVEFEAEQDSIQFQQKQLKQQAAEQRRLEALELQNQIVARGVEAVEVFAEKYRSDFDLTGREAETKEILRRREERRVEKYAGNSLMCLDIIFSVIAAVFESIDNEGASTTKASAGSSVNKFSTKKVVQENKVHEPVFIATECVRILEDKLIMTKPPLTATGVLNSRQQQRRGSKLNDGLAGAISALSVGTSATIIEQISLKEIQNMDFWPAFVCLAGQLGRWQVRKDLAGAKQGQQHHQEHTLRPRSNSAVDAITAAPVSVAGTTLVGPLSNRQPNSLHPVSDLRMPLTPYHPYAHRDKAFFELSRQILERVLQLVADGNKIEQVSRPNSAYATLLATTPSDWTKALPPRAGALENNEKAQESAENCVSLQDTLQSHVFLVVADPKTSCYTPSAGFNQHVTSAADAYPFPKAELWTVICEWLGGSSAAVVWDIEESVKLGQALNPFSISANEILSFNPKDAPKGSTAPALKTFGDLIHLVFGDEELPLPSKMSTTSELPFYASPVPEFLIRIISDIVEASNRLLCVRETVEAANEAFIQQIPHDESMKAAVTDDSHNVAKLAVPDYSGLTFPFTECTFAALNGQCLFVRSFLRQKLLIALSSADNHGLRMLIPAIAFVSCCHFTCKGLDISDRLVIADKESFPVVFNHFLRGNTRDSVTTNGDVSAAVAAETSAIAKYQAALAAVAAGVNTGKDKSKGAAPKPAAAPKKAGAGSTEGLECTANLSGIIHLSHVDEPAPTTTKKGKQLALAAAAVTFDTEKSVHSHTAKSLTQRNPLSSVLHAYFSQTATHSGTGASGLIGLEEHLRRLSSAGLPLQSPYVHNVTDAAGKPAKVDPAVTAAVATLNTSTIPLPVYTFKRNFAALHASGSTAQSASMSMMMSARGGPEESAPEAVDSFLYTGPVLFSELVVCCVLDAVAINTGFQRYFQGRILSLQQTAQAGAAPVPGLASAATASVAEVPSTEAVYQCARVLGNLCLRRQSYAVDIRLSLDHLSGLHPLNTTHAILVHEKICQCAANELQLLSLLLLSQGSLLQSVENSLRQREASLVKLLKSEDPRWQQCCRNTLDWATNLIVASEAFPNYLSSLKVGTDQLHGSSSVELHGHREHTTPGSAAAGATNLNSISAVIAGAREESKVSSALGSKNKVKSNSAGTRETSSGRGSVDALLTNRTQPASSTHGHYSSFHKNSEQISKLQAEVEGKVNFELRFLVCKLGDIIDERHMHWLDRSNAMFAETDIEYNRLHNHCNNLLNLMAHLCHHIIDQKRDAVESMVNLLSSAGYTSMPWATSAAASIHSKPFIAKQLIDKRRQNLRESLSGLPHAVEMSSLLTSSLTAGSRPGSPVDLSQGYPHDSSGGGSKDVENSFNTFLSLEVVGASVHEAAPFHPESRLEAVAGAVATTTASSDLGVSLVPVSVVDPKATMLSACISELYAEQLCAVTAFVDATSSGLHYIHQNMETFKMRNDAFIKSRHEYEHKMLSAWALELRGKESSKSSTHSSGLNQIPQLQTPQHGSAGARHSLTPASAPATLNTNSASLNTTQPQSAQQTHAHDKKRQKPLDLFSAVDFLASYHFGLSTEMHHDGVAWTIGGVSAVEVRDMTISVRCLVALVTEIFGKGTAGGEIARRGSLEGRRVSQPPQHLQHRSSVDQSQVPMSAAAGGGTSSDLAEEALNELVIANVTKTLANAVNSISTRVSVPTSWSRPSRVRDLVSRIRASTGSHTSEHAVLARLFLTLLYGVIPHSPPVTYIMSIFTALGRPTFASSGTGEYQIYIKPADTRMTVEDLLRRFTADKKIYSGWWAGSDETVTHMVLTVIAMCCVEDKTHMVNIPQFLLTLCKSTRFLETPFWEKHLILRPPLEPDMLKQQTLGVDDEDFFVHKIEAAAAAAAAANERSRHAKKKKMSISSFGAAAAAVAAAATHLIPQAPAVDPLTYADQRNHLVSYLPSFLMDGSFKALLVSSKMRFVAPETVLPSAGSVSSIAAASSNDANADHRHHHHHQQSGSSHTPQQNTGVVETSVAQSYGFHLTAGMQSLHELKGKRVNSEQLLWLLSETLANERGFAGCGIAFSEAELKKTFERMWSPVQARPLPGKFYYPHARRLSMGKVANLVRQVVHHTHGTNKRNSDSSASSVAGAGSVAGSLAGSVAGSVTGGSSDGQVLQPSHSAGPGGLGHGRQRQASLTGQVGGALAGSHQNIHSSPSSGALHGASNTHLNTNHASSMGMGGGAKRHSFSNQPHGNTTQSGASKNVHLAPPASETGPSGDFILATEAGSEALYSTDVYEQYFEFLGLDSNAFVIDRQF
jgi:hypothetical protein